MELVNNYIKKHIIVSLLNKNYDDIENFIYWEAHASIKFNNKNYYYKYVTLNSQEFDNSILIDKLTEIVLLDLGKQQFIKILKNIA